ncbi:glutaredoxin family protein [Timonella sp. A28]|uniref:glutaredoxin family protein n=1 Tax=Timonella sp. A28 TaxID=3442640 RepID=UPI003EBCC61F
MTDSKFSPTSEFGMPRVQVYTRVGCHLCSDALATVSLVCAEAGVSFEEIDIDQDLKLVEQYSEYVPVVVVDGVQQGFWRVDEARLWRAVNAGAVPHGE